MITDTEYELICYKYLPLNTTNRAVVISGRSTRNISNKWGIMYFGTEWQPSSITLLIVFVKKSPLATNSILH
jgi:hypothetical protein